MRLLILTQYFWPENFRINEFAVELARRGHDVCVLTGLPNYPQGNIYPDYRSDPHAFARLGGVEVVRVPLWPRGRDAGRLMANYASFALAAATIGAWKLRGRSFDAILVNQMSPATIGLPGVLLRKLKRAPTLFWVQDLWPDSLEAVGAVRSPLLLRFVERFLRWVYKRTDHILVQSRAFIPPLRRLVGNEIPISYLPNWAQPGAQPDASASAGSGDRQKTFNVYYLGNIGEAQDFPAVLDAVAQLSHRDDIHWFIVGDGSRAEWVREQLVSRGLQHRVSLPGAFPPQDMARFYSDADALLVCLRRERLFELTVPSKVQTYLAAGVPIIGMLDGEGARIIRDAGAGFACSAGGSAALAQAVETLKSLPREQRALMGQAGIAYNQQEFAFQRIVDRFERVVTESRR
jgi:colanic acid biosynthesis glycosyl transferase WcaI